MSNGTLRVQTYAARQSAPVPGVHIVLTNADDPLAQAREFYTNEEGDARDICLPAPDRSISLDEYAARRPYSVWDLAADKEGYQPLTIRGIQVFAGETALAELEMRPAQRLGAPSPLPDDFDVPPHQLYRPEDASPSSAPVQLCPQPAPEVLTVPIIPATITVHLGKPAASAQNVTVSFRKYIANVASSEVYPTWPEQALRANIHAQISLALNRIFTEWYPSKGYTFNITNSTSYDQYYVHGRNVFKVMERITDEIFNTYVRRTGTIEPYYTEYCDGKSVTCAGMKQWGTVDRAEEGMNALQILRYYYGGNKYDNAGGDARYAYNYKAQGSKNGHRKSGVQAKQAGSIIAAGRIVAEGMSAGGRKVRAMRAAGVKAVKSSLKVTVKHRRGSFL